MALPRSSSITATITQALFFMALPLLPNLAKGLDRPPLWTIYTANLNFALSTTDKV
jgi:hypothetical protein